MLGYDKISALDSYSLKKSEKDALFLEIMKDLTTLHYTYCPEYHRILDTIGSSVMDINSIMDIPFLPIRLFKEYSLRSILEESVVKVMTSSGTTGSSVSKIYLDRATSALQTKTLAKIVSSKIGKARLPMIILDTNAVIKDRNMFSARGAGILGFSIFGKDRIYALDENMNLNISELEGFLEMHSGETILLFGFTFMIWQHFYGLLKKHGYRPDLSNGILIHGGGWKKLKEKAITSLDFKQAINKVCGIRYVYDYYGMVEQMGSICMECESGYLHSSNYSDIIVRRHEDFSLAEFGEKGIIQTLSVLPRSYPGHSLLTEDEGVLLGEDDCSCGSKGKYFSVLGRINNAETRGCSNTYDGKL